MLRNPVVVQRKTKVMMSQAAGSIFERDRAGETIRLDDPGYSQYFKVIQKAIRTIAGLNTGFEDD